MAFDVMGKLKDLKSSAEEIVLQKGQEVLGQMNLLLKLLEDAGYEISQMEAALSATPEITIHLKTGPMVSDSKLQAVFQANQNNEVLALILGALIQANKLRDSVNAAALELKGAKIVLKATPSITLEWKEKEKEKRASA